MDVEWVIGDGSDDNSMTLNEWIANGNTVTADMIISARYTLKKLNLTVIDFSDEANPDETIRRIEDAKDIDETVYDFNVKNQN